MLWPISYLSVIFFSLRYLYVIFRRVSSLLTTPLSKYIPKVKGKPVFFRRFLDSSVRGCDMEIYTLVRLTGFAVCLEGTQCDALICIATQR